MSLNIEIKDGKEGSQYRAKVTELGQIVTAPLAFSKTYYNSLTTINTAFNYMSPKTRQNIVITDIIISGDRNIGANGSLVEIYCATSADTITVEEEILTVPLAKNASLPLTGLNLLIPSGFWVNAKCDDDIVYITIMGYYVDNI